MLNLFGSLFKISMLSTSCAFCESDSTGTTGCSDCDSECGYSCENNCNDSDTSGLSAGVCASAGRGNTESGCRACNNICQKQSNNK